MEKNIQTKVITATTQQGRKKYNEYFIDNDDWVILMQWATPVRGGRYMETLLISRSCKPFTLKVGGYRMAWDGFKIHRYMAKNKIIA